MTQSDKKHCSLQLHTAIQTQRYTSGFKLQTLIFAKFGSTYIVKSMCHHFQRTFSMAIEIGIILSIVDIIKINIYLLRKQAIQQFDEFFELY